MISTQKLDVIATSCHAKALWVNIKNLNCAQHVPVIAFRSVDQILSFKVKNLKKILFYILFIYL